MATNEPVYIKRGLLNKITQGATPINKVYIGENLLFGERPNTFNYSADVKVDSLGDFDIISPDDRYRYNVQVDSLGDFDVSVVENNTSN